ncbi:CRISPR-associated endoribonuclease Cas6 [Shouchella lonarensis]|uniref:CRISPR-associated endoribonuclease Cas6 n=2 Tax=Shouchella lonarensis TaxID=1464122 RepID=A0A1G6INV8_9BACI|nr:CRISPR-associated endoribonuclease Cas6 [Shouchella lonarensis]
MTQKQTRAESKAYGIYKVYVTISCTCCHARGGYVTVKVDEHSFIKDRGENMRIAVTYNVKELPVGYRMLVLSSIKEALKLGDKAYFERLYASKERQAKPFSFATFLKEFSYEGEKISLSEMTVTVSSPDMEFLVHLFNGLQQMKCYKMRTTEWHMREMKWLKEVDIQRETAYFRTMAPLLVEDRFGRPIHPGDTAYIEELCYYAITRIEALAGRKPYRSISITPGRLKKRVIKESNTTFRAQRSNKHLMFTAYHGTYKISGHPKDLQLLYQGGLGRRVSQGFGLLEYVGEKGA